MSVTDKWTPEGEKLMRELKELAGLEVFVGFQRGEKHDEAEADVVDIAAFNELGTSNGIPSRPFVRQTADNHASEIDQAKQAVVQHVANGGTAQQAADNLGVFISDLMVNEIKEGGFAANHPKTIKRKGSDVPLIDTGQMRQSVYHVVRKKGSGGD